MSKPVYRNTAFWLLVLLIVIIAAFSVVVFWVVYNDNKAELPDEEEGSAQIGMRWHPLARRERPILEIAGRQRRHGHLRRVCCHPQRTVMETPIRPDLAWFMFPLSENPGLLMPGKAVKGAFPGKVDSPIIASLGGFLEIGHKQRPDAGLWFVQQGSQRSSSEAPHRRVEGSTDLRLAKNPGVSMPKTCQKGVGSTISYARKSV